MPAAMAAAVAVAVEAATVTTVGVVTAGATLEPPTKMLSAVGVCDPRNCGV